MSPLNWPLLKWQFPCMGGSQYRPTTFNPYYGYLRNGTPNVGKSYGGWRKSCTTPMITNNTMNHTNPASIVQHWGYHKLRWCKISVICPNWPLALSLKVKNGVRGFEVKQGIKVVQDFLHRHSLRCALYVVQGATGSTRKKPICANHIRGLRS